MFNTPRKQGGVSDSFNTPTKKVPLNGFFSDGTWLCNCNPRLPAPYFKVKKDGPNHGKGFYTCQEPKETSCGFFLWEEKARGREAHAVLSNSRSEPHTPSDIDRPSTPIDPSKDKRTLQGHAIASNKWMADRGDKDEDELGTWPLSREDEEKVVRNVEGSNPGSFPETPKKDIDSRTATPGSKRKRGNHNALPTPMTTESRDEDIFGTPASRSTRRLNGGMWDGNERSFLRLPTPSVTPSPYKFKDATATPATAKYLGSPEKRPTGETQSSYDITEDVMNLLKDQHIDDEIDSKLRQILNKHAMKMSGIVKGRDITRVALKSKEAKIAELQNRITALENERDLSSALIKRLREGDKVD